MMPRTVFGFLGVASALLSSACPLAASAQESSRICVDVQVGDEILPDYDCLTQHLRERASRERPHENMPPLAADSPANAVGIVTETAVRQQFGKNLGVSPRPFRPARRFPTPLVNQNR